MSVARTTRRAAAQLIDQSGIPNAISFRELVTLVGEHRGTTIEVRESRMLGGAQVCGAWTGKPGLDVIHVPSDAGDGTMLFIACHELGHMLAEPVASPTVLSETPEVLDFLRSVVNMDRVVPYAFRGADKDVSPREVEAEAVGQQLALRVLRAHRLNRPHFRFEQVFAR